MELLHTQYSLSPARGSRRGEEVKSSSCPCTVVLPSIIHSADMLHVSATFTMPRISSKGITPLSPSETHLQHPSGGLLQTKIVQ